MFRLFIVNCAFFFINKIINFSFFIFKFLYVFINVNFFVFSFFNLFSNSLMRTFVFVNRSFNWFVMIWIRSFVNCARFAIIWMYSWLRRHYFNLICAFFFRLFVSTKMKRSWRSTFSNSRTIFFIDFWKRFENCAFINVIASLMQTNTYRMTKIEIVMMITTSRANFHDIANKCKTIKTRHA